MSCPGKQQQGHKQWRARRANVIRNAGYLIYYSFMAYIETTNYFKLSCSAIEIVVV